MTEVVRAAIAPLHAEARVSSPQTSQRLAGQTLDVLETRDDWLRVRGEDAYEGWVHRGYLVSAGQPSAVGGRLSLGATVRAAGDPQSRTLPLGARLTADDAVEAGEVVESAQVRGRFPREAAAIVRTAVEYFAGTSYQWGGITPWGADCSGLVQTVFWLHGINLPRDAREQSETGSEVSSRLESLAAADLLFFSDRADFRITHVGIATGPCGMVHLGLGRGGYAVERLEDVSDGYVAALWERLRVVRRVV